MVTGRGGGARGLNEEKMESFVGVTAAANKSYPCFSWPDIWGIGEYFQAFLFKSEAASFIIIF